MFLELSVTLTEEGLCYDGSKSEVFKSNLASCKLIFHSQRGRHYGCVFFKL